MADKKQKNGSGNAPMQGNVILRFDKVLFSYGPKKAILDEADFVIREGAKIALMGQNGAGKSTIFKLITKEIEPEEGGVHINTDASIATAFQVIPRAWQNDTVVEFFCRAFSEKVYDIEPRARKVLDAVNFAPPLDKKIGLCSGGEQARLLLAFALIQNPDILLLDEPTNNLDREGIDHLTKFLIEYKKTCIVISHDANFLNAFTHGVLYLDSFTHKVEQYVGNYLKVVEEIAARIERERMKNVRLERDIANRKEQMGFFAQKGGKMRDVARKMREAIEELEAQIVDMREEDKTIRSFSIPTQSLEAMTAETGAQPIVAIKSVNIVHGGKSVKKAVSISLRRRQKLLVKGPNGIGKSSFLDALASGTAKGATILEGISIGYYKQDFAGLDFSKTVYDTLAEVMTGGGTEETLRSVAAQFLLTEEIIRNKVETLSEGQKGLLMFARFVLAKPGLLILDEPTNHVNFRHLPVIAEALDKFGGALILVSHMPDFVAQIKFDDTLDLGAL
jgi:ATPase subunit of ABC transporter with duplicated ATPase domains